MLIININTKSLVIDIARMASLQNDAEFERKHKRDKDGKFAKQEENSKSKIEIQGNELGAKSMSSEELRQKAISYYKDNLAGTSVEHPKLGTIIFFKKGFKKPVSFSADTRKLKLFPFLPEIIKMGEIIDICIDKKGRKNVEEFYVLKTDVFLEGEKVCIRTTIRKDDKGKLYYDHVIKRPLGLFTGSTNPAVTSQRSNNSLTDTEYVVNIFFENKKV